MTHHKAKAVALQPGSQHHAAANPALHPACNGMATTKPTADLRGRVIRRSGCSPVQISQRMTPRDQMSVADEQLCPLSCSGELQKREPL